VSRVLRIRLTGEEAELGRVAAGDVARMLLGIERAVARAAGHVLGRQVKPTGRRGRSIEETTRLRLLGIEEGSVVGVLELPDATCEDGTLDLDVVSLGEAALDQALATANGEETEHRDVAEAFVRLADDVGVGARFTALQLDADGGSPGVTLDRVARDRLDQFASSAPPARDDSLIGVLFEANFETNTARLRTPGGQQLDVLFSFELADAIQEGLRRQAELVGEVSYDPKTMEARSVDLHKIVRSEQLSMGLETSDFWSTPTISEISEARGLGPVTDMATLRDTGASAEEVDRVLAFLDEM